MDTGSSYSSLPESLLDELGIEREETRRFELADNMIVEYHLGETRVLIEGREKTVPVMFAPNDTMPLVGATRWRFWGWGLTRWRRRWCR